MQQKSSDTTGRFTSRPTFPFQLEITLSHFVADVDVLNTKPGYANFHTANRGNSELQRHEEPILVGGQIVASTHDGQKRSKSVQLARVCLV